MTFFAAHHRSPPSVTPWKTQCAPSVLSERLDACPWNVKAPTGCGNGVVLGLMPIQDNVGLYPSFKALPPGGIPVACGSVSKRR